MSLMKVDQINTRLATVVTFIKALVTPGITASEASIGTMSITGLSTYDNDSSAGTGGLTTGEVYKTSTGELRIKL